MTSHLLATVSAPAWGASPAPGTDPAARPGSRGGPGSRGAGRGALADLLGGGAILLAWLFLWSWFALAMVQPVRRAAPSGEAQALARSAASAPRRTPGPAARGHMVPPDTSRSFRTEATPQRAPQAAQTS